MIGLLIQVGYILFSSRGDFTLCLHDSNLAHCAGGRAPVGMIRSLLEKAKNDTVCF